MLNQHSPIPLYLQIAERLRSHMQSGEYKVGEKIPSEHQLARQFQVGRPTVRQATDLLIREGFLQRRRGSGTYVIPKTPPIDLFSLIGMHATLHKTDLETQIELISPITLITPDNLYHFKRRTRIDASPVLLESIYLQAPLFPNFEQQNLHNTSLSALVRDVYYLEASSADQTFRIALADEYLAQQLDVTPDTPLLLVKRTLHFGEQRAAICCDIYCRTDRFEFSQTLTAHSAAHKNYHSHPNNDGSTQPAFTSAVIDLSQPTPQTRERTL